LKLHGLIDFGLWIDLFLTVGNIDGCAATTAAADNVEHYGTHYRVPATVDESTQRPGVPAYNVDGIDGWMEHRPTNRNRWPKLKRHRVQTFPACDQINLTSLIGRIYVESV